MNYHSVSFEVGPFEAALPGDYDRDGSVNDADYVAWKSGFGSTGTATIDGNRNGIVDAADYTIWRDHTVGRQLPGDFNSDGGVDGADYLIWRETFGSTSKLRADANGNSVIDSGDYTTWRDNFGSNRQVGDYNLDQAVDSSDYQTWRLDFGSTTRLSADGNGNAVVDAADYTIWRDRLQPVGNAADVHAVAEPSSAVILVPCVAVYLSLGCAMASVDMKTET